MQLLRLLQLVERGLRLRRPHGLCRPLVHQLVQIVREGAFLVVAVVHLRLDVQGGLGTWLRAWGQAAGGRPWGVIQARIGDATHSPSTTDRLAAVILTGWLGQSMAYSGQATPCFKRRSASEGFAAWY